MRIEWHVSTDKEEFAGAINHESGPLHVRIPCVASEIESILADIHLEIDDDEKIFMNGYQTWTACPEYTKNDKIRGLHGLPKFMIDHYSFDRYGDYHFVDYPNKKGVTHGFSWTWFKKGDHYRFLGSLDEDPGYTMFTYDANRSNLHIERDAKGLKCDGEIKAFDLFYAEGSESEVFDAWFKELGIEPNDKRLYGYSSWYNRYQNITEADILKDLEGCRSVFEPGDMFQIDDGWEPFIGDWLAADEKKFPLGMKAVADKIHEAGFKAGLWLAPFVAEEKSKLYQEHQDWLLKVDGKNWKAGCNWSGYYPLDIDNPEVQDYLKQVFERVFEQWGFDMVKLDFLYAVAPYGSENETRAGKMHRAMKWIRELCGDKEILGCGVPLMPAFGLVDYCRISCDVGLDYNDNPIMRIIHRERVSTRQAVWNILSRHGLNGRAWGSDGDVIFLRTENIKLTEQQKDSLARMDALLENVLLTSDDPSNYTDEMKAKYKMLRHLTTATNIRLSTDNGITITYDLDGEEHTEKIDWKL